ncbi:MAG: alpha/beta family hydrolase [Acidobacteriota bacterium]
MTLERRLDFEHGGERHELRVLDLRPAGARALYVFGHGAGAGADHGFMEDLAVALAERGIATSRPHLLPFMRSRDRTRLFTAIRTLLDASANEGLPLFAAGKSMGGRMTSLALAAEPRSDVLGLVFVGFPLHPPKKKGIERAEHLDDVPQPLLFLQGTRDALADLSLFRPVAERLGERATLHVVEGADHGFAVLKRSGRTSEEVLVELADVAADWMLARV